MGYVRFTTWVEEMDAKKQGIREILLGYFRDKLGVNEKADEMILGMKTNEFQDDIVNDLTSRGIVSTSAPDVANQIKNGISVQELIDMLSSASNPRSTPASSEAL